MREVHGNTQEGLWTGVQKSLRPFRGVGKWYEDQYLVAIRFRLERVRRIGGAVEVEVVFGINRLPRERADAAEWLRLTRVHWGIDIRLHGRRDGALARTPAGCGRGRRRG